MNNFLIMNKLKNELKNKMHHQKNSSLGKSVHTPDDALDDVAEDAMSNALADAPEDAMSNTSDDALDAISLAQKIYLRHQSIRRHMITSARIAIFILFVLLWETGARTGSVDAFIFSSPSRIASTFLTMCRSGDIFIHTGITLAETLLSFILVIFAGILLAILLWASDTVSGILEPYLVILNSLPKSALAPVLIVWLGNNPKTIIVTAISIAVFGTIINLYTSFAQIDSEKVKLIRMLGGSRLDVLFRLILPSSLPIIISNAKVNIGLCLVGVIIGEFLAARRGLGFLIIYGSQTFKMDWVLMSIVILCLIAGLLYLILNKLEKCVNKYIEA